MKLFTQKEVNKIFNHIPSKTLRWWGMRDLYGWANQINDGRGIHREYELDHLYQIGIVEELSSLNIPVEAINRIMRKHFLYGMVMQSLWEDLERDELGGGSVRPLGNLPGQDRPQRPPIQILVGNPGPQARAPGCLQHHSCPQDLAGSLSHRFCQHLPRHRSPRHPVTGRKIPPDSGIFPSSAHPPHSGRTGGQIPKAQAQGRT